MKLFFEKWLIYYGATNEDASHLATLVQQRVKRYPMIMPLLHFFSVTLVELILPLFFCGKITRFSSLEKKNFFSLEKKLSGSKILFVRLIYLFVRLPLFEIRYAENKSSNFSYQHPLRQKITATHHRDFDVIVIGSGAGGAPVACELAKSGKKVAVFESGDLVKTQTVSSALEKYYYNQGFTFSALKGMNLVLAGNTVGGTTSINSGTSLPPRVDFLEKCDEILGTRFASGELDPYLKRVHDDIGIVTPPRERLGKSGLLFEQGLHELGLKGSYVLPRNAAGCEGSGRCCFVCPTQGKKSTDLNYLSQALDYGAHLFIKSKVIKIKETQKGVEVWVVDESQKKTRYTAKKLVIAGGVFGTTQLIRKNKLGRFWKSVGLGLRMHPASKVFAFFDDGVEDGLGIPQGIGYKEERFPHIVFEGVHTPRAGAAPMIQAVGESYKQWLDNYHQVATFGLMLVDRKGGRLSFVRNWPIVDYELTENDVEEIKRALIFCGKVFFAAGAKCVLLPFTGVVNEFSTREALINFSKVKVSAKNLYTSGFHPQGTAAMGKVVDENLKLYGCENVFVSDASVLPVSPGVNPQVTIMALSLRLADHMI